MNRFLLIAGMLLGICAVLRAVELPPGSVLESNGILKIPGVFREMPSGGTSRVKPDRIYGTFPGSLNFPVFRLMLPKRYVGPGRTNTALKGNSNLRRRCSRMPFSPTSISRFPA